MKRWNNNGRKDLWAPYISCNFSRRKSSLKETFTRWLPFVKCENILQCFSRDEKNEGDENFGSFNPADETVINSIESGGRRFFFSIGAHSDDATGVSPSHSHSRLFEILEKPAWCTALDRVGTSAKHNRFLFSSFLQDRFFHFLLLHYMQHFFFFSLASAGVGFWHVDSHRFSWQVFLNHLLLCVDDIGNFFPCLPLHTHTRA